MSFDEPQSIRAKCQDIILEYREDPHYAHEREDALLKRFIQWLLTSPKPSIEEAVEIAKIITHDLLEQPRTKWYA